MRSEDRRLPVGAVENNNYKSSVAIQEVPRPHPFMKGTPRKNKKSRFTPGESAHLNTNANV